MAGAGEPPQRKVLAVLTDFARQHKHVQGLFVFGSVGRGSFSASSDVDTCMILDSMKAVDAVSRDLVAHFAASLVHTISNPKKVVLFLRLDSGLLKVGVGLVDSLAKKAEYFITSELYQSHVPQMVQYEKKQERSADSAAAAGALSVGLSHALSAAERTRLLPADYSAQWQAAQFLLKLESCSACSLSDAHDSAFHLVLARHYLLVLELGVRGERAHLYRPPRAFERYPGTHCARLSADLHARESTAIASAAGTGGEHAAAEQDAERCFAVLLAHAAAFVDVCTQLNSTSADADSKRCDTDTAEGAKASSGSSQSAGTDNGDDDSRARAAAAAHFTRGLPLDVQAMGAVLAAALHRDFPRQADRLAREQQQQQQQQQRGPGSASVSDSASVIESKSAVGDKQQLDLCTLVADRERFERVLAASAPAAAQRAAQQSCKKRSVGAVAAAAAAVLGVFGVGVAVGIGLARRKR